MTEFILKMMDFRWTFYYIHTMDVALKMMDFRERWWAAEVVGSRKGGQASQSGEQSSLKDKAVLKRKHAGQSGHKRKHTGQTGSRSE